MLSGSDLLNLTVLSPAVVKSSTGPYTGRYPSTNLHYNRVWYQSTYGVSHSNESCHGWWVQCPFISFRYSADQDKSWTEYNPHP